MPNSRTLPLLLLSSAMILVAAGCARLVNRNLNNGNPPTRPTTAAPTVVATTRLPTLPATANVTESPAVTQDVLGLLLTQAYSQFTPRPSATVTVAPTTSASSGVAVSPSAVSNPAPAALIVSEPIQITNAVNTADCKIRGIGNCTTTMKAGNTLFFNWTFGVKGAEAFHWGQAAVVITRNGETFKWSQSGNGLVKPPAKNEGWTLNVGQSAKFAGSLDNAEPGFYVARLWMCTLSPTECNAGQGWQSVGGNAIQFVIEP